MAGAAGAGGNGGSPAVVALLGLSGAGKTTLHRRLAFDPDRPGAFTGPLRPTKAPIWGDVTLPPATTTTTEPKALPEVAPAVGASPETARVLDVGGAPAARAEWPAVLAHTPPNVVVFVVDATAADPQMRESVEAFKDVLFHRDVVKDGAATGAATARDAAVVILFNRRGPRPGSDAADDGQQRVSSSNHTGYPDVASPEGGGGGDSTQQLEESATPPSTTSTSKPPRRGFAATNSGTGADDIARHESLDSTSVAGNSFGERPPMSPHQAGDEEESGFAAHAAPQTPAGPGASPYLERWGDLRAMLAAAVTERRGAHAVLAPGSVCAMRYAVVDADVQTGDGVDELLRVVARL
eukprot:CAMPEP_0174876402 /NCGR_PEP_ID=MMETSP1114-20130205/80090_1 /TAXON_ID=312471 /ORGANISM="Neobodo designis, Strain CCAP 1951/1" /LENGTH=352 /DNA_ID=CAMNT_0016111777 /DNA_START=75 /DNA_END=1130 /DNA_ORIENTATION=+